MNNDVSIILSLSFIIFLSPFISKLIKIPITPVEIMLGSIAGYLGFISSNNHLFELIAELGFLYLMFLAGIEVNLRKLLEIDKTLLKQGFIYLVLLYALSIASSYYLNISRVFMVILPLISVGLIVTLTKEYGKDVKWLKLSMLIGTLGEVVSIIVLTFVSGILEFGLGFEFYKTMFFLVLFLILFILLFKLLRVLFWWYPEIKTFLMPHSDKDEKDIRISMALFFITIAITIYLNLEVAFGAFLAGIFIRTFFEHKKELPHKLESFGFGFLVPIFFVNIGASFEINSISREGLICNAVLIVTLMVSIRIISSLVFLKILSFKEVILFALSQSMPLTLLIAVATLAYYSKSISELYYFAFILASLFEVIIGMIGIKIIKGLKKEKITS